MIKILVFLILVQQVVSVEYFLARMLVLLERNSAKNQYISIEKKAGSSNGYNVTKKDSQSCSVNEIEILHTDDSLSKFTFNEDLIVTWKQQLLWINQNRLMGYLNIKYHSNEYKEVKTEFYVCDEPQQKHRNDQRRILGRQIFLQTFIQKIDPQARCFNKMTNNVGSRYYWNGELLEGIHCNANATIHIDLYAKVDADCGIGGSGDSYTYNIFRVVFNARFEDCDGKKYELFKGFSKKELNIAKAEAAVEIIDELAKLPII